MLPMLLLDSFFAFPPHPWRLGQNLALGHVKEYGHVVKAFAPIAPALASFEIMFFLRSFQLCKFFTSQYCLSLASIF
jgi:hypothetical protein